MSSTSRPDRTTMEGMIWNANHVLEQALAPDTAGIPKGIVLNCKGIVLISVAEIGFVFSGNVGSGVMLSRTDEGTWSPPVAVGLAGLGFGFMAGAEIKDIVMIIMDNQTLNSISSELQVKIGGQLSATLGPVGRESEVAANFSHDGIGATAYTYTYSKGIFGGVSLESAILSVRSSENKRFYGKPVMARDILLDFAVIPRTDKGVEDLYHKLKLLGEGKFLIPTESMVQKKILMKKMADAAGANAKGTQTAVAQGNAEEEADYSKCPLLKE